MKIDNILELIKEVGKLNIESFEYEEEGSKISVKFGGYSTKVLEAETVVSQVAAPVVEAIAEVEKAFETIKSPLVGTFYSAPSESAPAFIKVGQTVTKGQTVGIVEAMKLMNEIPSTVEGTVSKVLVENGQMVEYGQPLFEIV